MIAFTTAMTPLFGFAFANPWVLGGLILAGIPILIHLLHKRQFQETSWAAMRFLLAATRRNSRRLQLQQLLLLAIRTLALVLVIVALARPFFDSTILAVTKTEPTHRIVVIDASCSMQRTIDQQTLFEQAKRIASSVVESANKGDAIQLVRICDQSNRIVVSEPAWDKQIVIDEIDRLQSTFENGDIANALQDVERLLDTVGELKKRQVCIISDFQAGNWNPVGSAADSIQESLIAISQAASLQLVGVNESTSAENIAVTGCQVEDGARIVGQSVRISGNVRRWGSKPEAKVRLLINDREVASKAAVFKTSDEASVSFDYIASDAGSYTVQLQVDGDQYSPDDQRWTSMKVLDNIDVLLVNGRQSGRAMGNASDYVKLSLQPFDANDDARSIQVREITDGELMSIDPDQFECIFLCNVGLFTDQESDFLSRYVQHGGGLVFLLGDQVRTSVWNRVLFRNGEGILPVELMNRVGKARDPADAFVFDTTELDHPLVRDYRGNPGFGLENVLTFEYFKVTPSTSAKVRSVLSFTNGDPCIVDSDFGNGRVLTVMTSGDDRRWCTWNTIGGTFATLMNEMVSYTSFDDPGSNVLVGQAVFVPLDSGAVQKVSSPDGETTVLAGTADENRVSFRKTTLPGIYRSSDPQQQSDQLFAVNVDPIESDPKVLTKDELEESILNGVDYNYATDLREQRFSGSIQGRSTGPLVKFLLWTVATLLLIEQVMAWRFDLGLVLLLSALSMAFLFQAWTVGSTWGMSVIAIAGVTALAIAYRRWI